MQVGQLYDVYRKNGEDILFHKELAVKSQRAPRNTLMVYIDTERNRNDPDVCDVHIVYMQEYGICYLYGDDEYVFQKVICK